MKLQALGVSYELTAFANGMEAVEHFQKNRPPDLIVSDWILPCMDFPEFAARIRAVPKCESVPIAVCSGSAVVFEEQALKLGAICCPQKPIGAAQLAAVLNQIGNSVSA
jgi:sigma-B regulation protein RsbU (phosphoserine phosphatase)